MGQVYRTKIGALQAELTRTKEELAAAQLRVHQLEEVVRYNRRLLRGAAADLLEAANNEAWQAARGIPHVPDLETNGGRALPRLRAAHAAPTEG